MSNDHKANIKDSFANKAGEAKKGAVPDSHDKLVQARLNREVDATLNQAKILLDSEPKNSAAKNQSIPLRNTNIPLITAEIQLLQGKAQILS
ncbi:MAG: hypothetical protein II731_01890 [Succinivibrio sp.]|nr:hypothetical protein [Succinivibrio sp.]